AIEGHVSHPGIGLLIDYIDVDFNLGFIFRFGRPGGQYNHSVIVDHIQKGFIDQRIVPVGRCNSGFKIVRNNGRGNATKFGYQSHKTFYEVFLGLRRDSYGKGVIAVAERYKKNFYRHRFSGLSVYVMKLISSKIDKHLVSGLMQHHHGWMSAFKIPLQMMTKPGVL